MGPLTPEYLNAHHHVTPDELTRYLRENVPLTRHLGFDVVSIDSRAVRVRLPFEPNRNHHDSVFGGSIATLGILAGWAAAFVRLEAEGIRARLVIQSSATEYLKPALGPLEATCGLPDDLDWSRAVEALRRHGRARLELAAGLASGGEEVARHLGRYVAIAREP